MAKIKLTKNELKKKKDALKMYRRYLPTLQLKKQQLQMEIRGVEARLDQLIAQKIALEKAYEAWIADFSFCPVLTIPTDNLDFVAMPNHMDLVLKKVEEKIAGKEEVIFLPEEYTASPPD